MPSLITIIFTLLALYFTNSLYRFLRNLQHARNSGVSTIIAVPWDQNGALWMVSSVPLRPLLKRYLPDWLFNRVDLTIYGHEFHQQQQHTAMKEGSYVLVTPGAFEFVTKDPEVSVELMKRVGDFQSHEFTHLFLGRFGGNVFTSDGEDWARQRKVVASVINERVSKAVWRESLIQTEGLLKEAEGGGGETNRLFDGMKKITINVLSGAGMGARVSWEEEKEEEVKPGFRMNYMQAVNVVIEGVTGPLIMPLWLLKGWPSFLPGKDFLHRVGCAVEEFPRHTRSMLEKERQRQQSKEGEAGTQSNIMSQLIRANQAGDDDSKGLSETEMVGNLFIFTAAGFDTTANTLAYALVLLCRYPEWQNWIFEELDTIIPAGEDLDYASIYPRALRILAFMHETLRLFPPVIHLTKQTRTPQTLTTPSGKTSRFPAKANIYVNTVATHLNPAVWRNLNLHESEKSEKDEFVFRPSRWITEQKTLFSPPRGSFVPWAGGPRVCPGQKMAQVEFTAIFIGLLRRHRIEAVSKAGEGEGKEEVERRLDGQMRDSMSILTLQMNGIYDRKEGDGEGFQVRLSRRR